VFPSARVLEIGASNLARTQELSRWCRELIGVELLRERTPKDFGNVKYFTGDWQNLGGLVAPKSIDVAVSTHVIEHVPNDLRAINELYGALRPGGIAILNTPNRKRLTRAVVEKLRGKRRFPYGEHQREYSESDLKQLIDASHFHHYSIFPVVFGLHGGPMYAFTTMVPESLRGLASFWEIHLFKESN